MPDPGDAGGAGPSGVGSGGATGPGSGGVGGGGNGGLGAAYIYDHKLGRYTFQPGEAQRRADIEHQNKLWAMGTHPRQIAEAAAAGQPEPWKPAQKTASERASLATQGFSHYATVQKRGGPSPVGTEDDTIPDAAFGDRLY